METTPVTPAARTTKVRAAKTVVPKSSKATSPADLEKPTLAEPRQRKTLTKSSSTKPKTVAGIAATPDDLTPMIATAAYYLAERRNFAPGYELQDWIAAEKSIRSSLAT